MAGQTVDASEEEYEPNDGSRAASAERDAAEATAGGRASSEVLLSEDLPVDDEPGTWAGHAAHQDPDADGTTTVSGVPADAVAGQVVRAEVVDTEGVDLVARALLPVPAASAVAETAGV